MVATSAGTNPATGVAPAGTAPAPAGTVAVAPTGTAPVPAAGTPDAPKATAPDAPKEATHHAKGEKHEPKVAAAKHERTGGDSPSVAAAAPPPSETPAPTHKKKGGDALDDLLNGASPDKPAAKHSAPKEESSGGDDSLPEQLDKGAIVGGMGKVKGKVASCYDQFKVPGMANVSVTIGKSGSVQSASVSGAFAGTPTGSCVEKAVKAASFPKFKGGAQTINYPFMLR